MPPAMLLPGVGRSDRAKQQSKRARRRAVVIEGCSFRIRKSLGILVRAVTAAEAEAGRRAPSTISLLGGWTGTRKSLIGGFEQ